MKLALPVIDRISQQHDVFTVWVCVTRNIVYKSNITVQCTISKISVALPSHNKISKDYKKKINEKFNIGNQFNSNIKYLKKKIQEIFCQSYDGKLNVINARTHTQIFFSGLIKYCLGCLHELRISIF